MYFDFNPSNVHPYLSDFRGVANSGLGTAQVFTYWQMDLPANSPAQRILDYLPAAQRPQHDQPQRRQPPGRYCGIARPGPGHHRP